VADRLRIPIQDQQATARTEASGQSIRVFPRPSRAVYEDSTGTWTEERLDFVGETSDVARHLSRGTW
jgi:hypothetical protein